jgi:predicted nucleotide-binding protein (sugar kinase/HSP70/actin superfamily)
MDIIFFPMIDNFPTPLTGTEDCRACPTVTTTPEAVKAAFIKEGDIFKDKGIKFLDTFVNIAEKGLFSKQMYEQFKDILGLSWKENNRAIEAGYESLEKYESSMRRKARALIDQLEKENRFGIVLLGRTYHNDPGINHEIMVEFQKLGYPVFTQECLPLDADILEKVFGDDVKKGIITDPMDIADVWKNSYSENTNRKVWGAKYTARHPNLIALELSNFKCGHDAPIYTVIEEIVENSGTPYFNFKDLDENKPSGSIKIRVETIHYFLKRYREDMLNEQVAKDDIQEKLKEYRLELEKKVLLEDFHMPAQTNGKVLSQQTATSGELV